MNYYRREDGAICKAIQWNGGDAEIKEHLFEVMDLLAHADLQPSYRAEEITDEWQENEAGDDYEQVVIPQHIKLGAGDDEMQVGDYVVERDGDTYIMGGPTFEAIWSLAVTDAMSDWYWYMRRRLPFSTSVGYWVYKRDENIVSVDGGVTYFLMSERKKYQPYGPIYTSVKTETTRSIEQ